MTVLSSNNVTIIPYPTPTHSDRKSSAVRGPDMRNETVAAIYRYHLKR